MHRLSFDFRSDSWCYSYGKYQVSIPTEGIFQEAFGLDVASIGQWGVKLEEQSNIALGVNIYSSHRL
jgi:hypothetical protein